MSTNLGKFLRIRVSVGKEVVGFMPVIQACHWSDHLTDRRDVCQGKSFRPKSLRPSEREWLAPMA